MQLCSMLPGLLYMVVSAWMTAAYYTG
uniref:Uncharacterized protein n=1 Tax=Arundo donax TaxID=35708 RepID=A0A0A8YBI9_ARUDO